MNTSEPKTLQEAIVFFSNPDNCLAYLAKQRWPDGVVVCPTCGSKEVHFLSTRRLWQCVTMHSKRQFSIKLGTIMEDSPIGLDKWLTATWMLTNCKNGISSYEIARDIHVTQKSAWFMLHRLRLALQTGSLTKLGGGSAPIEVDETFIGGKARNMHKSKKIGRGFEKHGPVGKTVVMGMLQRGGKVKTAVIKDRVRETLHGHVNACIEEGSQVYTDEFGPYAGLDEKYSP